MQDVLRFWLSRGVDGFRLDAIDRLVKDPLLRDNPPASAPFGLPLHPEEQTLEPRYSRDQPGTGEALAALRQAAGDALLVGEVYCRPRGSRRTCSTSIALSYSSCSMRPGRRARCGVRSRRRCDSRAVPAPAPRGCSQITTSAACRAGSAAENERAAAMLLLTLPGTAFIYQGDEIGLANGPGADPPLDRTGRDTCRHPMQWDAFRAAGSPAAGRGCRWSTTASATLPPSARTPSRC